MFDESAVTARDGQHEPSRAVAVAVQALAGVGAHLSGLSDGELVSALSDVESLGRRVDALRVTLAGLAAERSRRELGPQRLSARHGCRTASELVARATGVSGVTAGRRIRLGAAVLTGAGLSGEPVPAAFPAVAAALEAGSLGVDAAHAIVAALQSVQHVAAAHHVATAERELVTAVTGPPDAPHRVPAVDADTVRLQAKVWVEFLDPDGAVPSDQGEQRRFVRLHAPRHGLVPISGLLLPEVASALRHYADACTNPKSAPIPDPTTAGTAATSAITDDTDGGDAAVGVATAGPTDAAEAQDAPPETRSRAQVMHDVLATVVQVAARVTDAPSVAGNAPTLVVIATAADLLSGRGTARTQDGAVVPISTARHVACGGAVQRVLVDRTGRIAGIGSPERCFTGPQRRAILARDRGCVIPGCHVPASWCEVHHVTPFAEDPDGTHTDNGVLLCWHHHRTIDTGGWDIEVRDGLVWTRPPSWIDLARRWVSREPGTRRRTAA